MQLTLEQQHEALKAQIAKLEAETAEIERQIEEAGKPSTLNELAKAIHENAVAHGWWEEPRSFGEIVALCHSELSEALEEHRDGKPNCYWIEQWGEDEDGTALFQIQTNMFDREHEKPEGVAVEMADCIIRILDWCGREGIDIDEIIRIKHEYNKSRPYRHGGKKL